jgi:hypothetical protein
MSCLSILCINFCVSFVYCNLYIYFTPLVCLRDIQNYDGIIGLVEDLLNIGQRHITHAQAVRFLYAFALNRRNKNGDRDKALSGSRDFLSEAHALIIFSHYQL